jgi:hypothetical protein
MIIKLKEVGKRKRLKLVKDFPFWHTAIYNAKTQDVLKSVGADLAQFQSQTDFAGVGAEPKLTPFQVEAIRKIYSEKLKKLKAEKL